MGKPKLAIYWNSSCGGCDEGIVDIEEKILDVAAQVEFVLWPCAMDFKYSDLEAMEKDEIHVALINGGIQNSEQEKITKIIREKSKMVIAFGACAWTGGIPSLANLKNRDDIFKSSYIDSPTVVNPDKTLPQVKSQVDGYELTLPEIYETVYKLDDIIDIDYYLPGCPPTADMVMNALNAILSGDLPEKGSILSPNRSLCFSCDRNETKPDKMTISDIKRIHEIEADPDICFLEQNVICMGPATRDGCDYPCVKGNMPCTGCLGPVDGADQGANMIGTLGGIIADSSDEKEIEKILEKIPDPAGTFYRYSIAASLLGRKKGEKS